MKGTNHSLVREIVGKRRGKPGALRKEVAEALIPILLKYKGTFGTRDQVAGCAIDAASECMKVVYFPNKKGW